MGKTPDEMDSLFREMEENVAALKENPRNGGLADRIMQSADEWAAWFWQVEIDGFYRDPLDEDGNAALDRQAQGVVFRTRWRGGARATYQAALTERFDVSEFCDIVGAVGDEIRVKAFYPYWVTHCHRLTDGAIYNNILKKFWNGKGWANQNGSGFNPFYPPPTNI